MENLIKEIKNIFEEGITEEEFNKRGNSVIQNKNFFKLFKKWDWEIEFRSDYFLLTSIFRKETKPKYSILLTVNIHVDSVNFEISKSWFEDLLFNPDDPWAWDNYIEKNYIFETKDREPAIKGISKEFGFTCWDLLTEKIPK